MSLNMNSGLKRRERDLKPFGYLEDCIIYAVSCLYASLNSVAVLEKDNSSDK